MARLSADSFDNARQHLYVNSWCMGDESMAMWQIYGSGGHGVAVRSTVGQYRCAAQFKVREEQCAFGPVEYDLAPVSSMSASGGRPYIRIGVRTSRGAISILISIN